MSKADDPRYATTDGRLPAPGLEDAGAPQPVEPNGQHGAYWVLSKEERAKGFVRPVRRSYCHSKCGTTTTMGLALCETYAREPTFYGATFCYAPPLPMHSLARAARRRIAALHPVAHRRSAMTDTTPVPAPAVVSTTADPLPAAPAPVSPTGLAVIPAKAVPYVLAAIAFAGALIGLASGASPVLPRLVPALPYLQAGVAVLTVLLGLTPGLRKAAPVVLLVCGLLLATPARAQSGLLVSTGPTVPVVLVEPGLAHPVQVQPGAGLQLSLSLEQLQKPLLGKNWDMLSLDLMAFGTLTGKGGGDEFGALSGALAACTLSSLICVGGGKHILDSAGIVDGGKGWFLVLALSFNISFSPPPSPVSTCASVGECPAPPPAPLHRGNTLYLSQ